METGDLFVYIKDEVIKMSAKVKVKNGNFQITIPMKEAYGNENFRRFLELQRAEEILSHSKASDESITALAEEIDRDNWEKNKEWFLHGLSD